MKKAIHKGRQAEGTSANSAFVNRRDVMKLGVGASLAIAGSGTLQNAVAVAQSRGQDDSVPLPAWGSLPMTTGPTRRVARAGYKNNANRAFGNGPMDDMTRQIVEFADKFWDSKLSDSAVTALNDLMMDSIGCIIAGFESQAARTSARVARMVQGTTMKSTVMGYGISSSPELATFSNCCMVRHNDFSDVGEGGHPSDSIPGILAIGETLHASGPRILQAVALAYEIMGAFQLARPRSAAHGWDTIYDGPAVAVAVSKLMGLSDDQFANALSLSLVTHMAFNASHSAGPLSMMKGCHNAETCRCAVFSCILAKEGMTGPCAPFQGTMGVLDVVAQIPFKIQLPAPLDPRDDHRLQRQPGQLVVEGTELKRFPSEGGTQAFLFMMPEFHQWTKPDEVASIDVEMSSFGEIGDPAKWDPQNEETADHSVPYLIARFLLDGDIFLDSFTKDKITDPKARALMGKTVIREVPDLGGGGPRITIKKVSGEQMTKHTPYRIRMTHDEVVAKFNRVFNYKSVEPAQRDKARSTWSNLMQVSDISVPIRDLAHFGKPLPL